MKQKITTDQVLTDFQRYEHLQMFRHWCLGLHASIPASDLPDTNPYFVIATPLQPDPVINMQGEPTNMQIGIEIHPTIFTVDKKEEYILYIDDDPDDRENFEYALAKCNAGINLTTAVDAEDAIAKLAAEQKPTCIYLDVNMPKMNGIQFLKLLKSNTDYAKIPVIIFSTAMDTKSRDEAMNLGAAGVVMKPSSLQGLLDHIYTSLLTHLQIPPSLQQAPWDARQSDDEGRKSIAVTIIETGDGSTASTTNLTS